MVNCKEISSDEFSRKQANFNFVMGEEESNYPKYYEVNFIDGYNSLLIGLINNYPNMDLDPQVEAKDNRLVIGNNETITIIDIQTKERKDFKVFPFFYKFLILDDRIIVVSEIEIFCLLNDEIVWETNDFEDVIDFVALENNQLIVSTYQNTKEICINILTGEQEKNRKI